MSKPSTIEYGVVQSTNTSNATIYFENRSLWIREDEIDNPCAGAYRLLYESFFEDWILCSFEKAGDGYLATLQKQIDK